MPEWYKLGADEVLKKFNSARGGLSPAEAAEVLQDCGRNELPRKGGRSKVRIFLEQFRNFMVLVLVAATAVSALMGEIVDALVILLIVVLNAILGFAQEYKAGKAVEALRKMTAPEAVVMRGGQEVKIPAAEVVPGDILVLSDGDMVAADARLLEVVNLQVDESSLTGESVPVLKRAGVIGKDCQVSEMQNMVFMNTIVTYGRATAVVTGTGLRTEVGKIAKMLKGPEDEETPLQQKLDAFGKKLGVGVILVSAVVAVAGILKGNPALEMFITGVSLAVAAVPEGLPAIVTITLAIGLTRMVKRNAIVRKLQAVETLGSADVICSDKTGTLTKNEMTVEEVYTDRLLTVGGEGYAPEGKILHGRKAVDPDRDMHLKLAVKIGALCNNARLVKEEDGWSIIGDPTEGSLVVLAKKAGLEFGEERVFEFPFGSIRKRMSTVYRVPGGVEVYAKGAPDILLDGCDRILKNGRVSRMTVADRERILRVNTQMASKALRVLMLAYKDAKPGKYSVDGAESGLIFVGLVGMMDPPREEGAAAIRLCKRAGVRPVMITGDHAETARAVAREVGILERGGVVSGSQIDGMTPRELGEAVRKVNVFARVSPEHKMRVLEALQSQGHVVAMTGDGVNDAPALHMADIGVAMGIKGTEVAKEASDMILTDDNFASIVAAIEEGRGIYDNIRKFIRYLLSCNAGEVLTLFAATLFLPVLPLFPVQILWMNLVTDGLPALMLGIEPRETGIMRRKPRRRGDDILSREMMTYFLIVGAIIAIGTLAVFRSEIADLARARTLAFTTIVMFQLFNAFNCRSERNGLLKTGIFSNKKLWVAVLISLLLQLAVVYVPFLQVPFRTVAIGLADWVKLTAVASSVFIIMEVRKWWVRGRE